MSESNTPLSEIWLLILEECETTSDVISVSSTCHTLRNLLARHHKPVFNKLLKRSILCYRDVDVIITAASQVDIATDIHALPTTPMPSHLTRLRKFMQIEKRTKRSFQSKPEEVAQEVPGVHPLHLERLRAARLLRHSYYLFRVCMEVLSAEDVFAWRRYSAVIERMHDVHENFFENVASLLYEDTAEHSEIRQGVFPEIYVGDLLNQGKDVLRVRDVVEAMKRAAREWAQSPSADSVMSVKGEGLCECECPVRMLIESRYPLDSLAWLALVIELDV